MQAHLFELIGGHVLDPEMDLKAWLERVLADATAGADDHPAVAAAAVEHRDSLFDIVHSGYLAEVDRRQRSWEAAGMGGIKITPEMLLEEAEAKRELEVALARKKLERKALMQPSPEAPQPEPEPPPLAWDKDVSIIFLSEERVQVRRGDQFSTMNYAEFGFEDKRNGKPDQAWVLLREMAENKGVLQKQDRRVLEVVLKPARDREKELHRARGPGPRVGQDAEARRDHPQAATRAFSDPGWGSDSRHGGGLPNGVQTRRKPLLQVLRPAPEFSATRGNISLYFVFNHLLEFSLRTLARRRVFAPWRRGAKWSFSMRNR